REVVKRYALNQQAANGGKPPGKDFAEAIDSLLEARFRARTVSAELRTLSSVIAEENIARIDLLKINAEKSELEILRGLQPDDWLKIQQMVIEVDQEASRASVVSLLEENGYEVCVEQDPLLRQTELRYVYAVRSSPERRLVREHAPGAHIRPLPAETRAAPTPQSVRAWLGERLPEYMVPQVVVFLPALPLLANGKVDRAALPAPASRVATGSAQAEAPRNPIEEVLSSLWRNLLGRDFIGREENFFDLGGDSILAIQIANRARDAGLELSPLQFFEHQTIAALAAAAREAGMPEDRVEVWDSSTIP
ncbi:MAG: phosphopantetheine-binding protein, partial [Opitutaceae bacterium]